MTTNSFAVVVTFHPDSSALERMVLALHSADCEVVIVDNTPGGEHAAWPSSATVLKQNANLGIARAQNIGIRHARANGAASLLFFDQDSDVSPELIRQLLSRLQPERPMVVGAVYFDARQGFECPSYLMNRWGYPGKIYVEGRTEPFEVDVRISSGSAITARTFDIAGELDESLFLDYVDVEWCLRARARGVPIYVDPKAGMRHAIGEKTIDVASLRLFVDGPVRTYYRMRNALLLLRKPEVPTAFAAKEVVSELVHQFLQVLLVPHRSARCGAAAQGFWHGVIGRGGIRP